MPSDTEQTNHPVHIGDAVKPIRLVDINGKVFESNTLNGTRYMISFFRFASCPFCNLRIHELISRYEELGDKFTIVAIFDSPLENLQQHTEKHHSPFPILADEENTYYRQYGVRHSWSGVFKGLILRFPILLKALLVHGYWPLKIKGKLNTMPVDILVNEKGLIDCAYYGKDEGDHLAFEKIRDFSHY